MKQIIYDLSAWTRNAIIIIIFWSPILLCNSYGQKNKSDSIIFHKYAMLRIQPTVNLRTLQELYQYWQAQDEGEKAAVGRDILGRPTDQPTLYWTGWWIPEHFSQPLIFRQLYKRTIKYLNIEHQSKVVDPDSIAQEKQNLIESLTAMDTLLRNKPLFFQVIHKRYKGNIASYVDDLYANSFMTSPKRFKQMIRRTRPKRLIKDLGVNYTLSMALYEVWLMQQSQEETSESVQ